MAKIFHGLGPKRRESSKGDRVYIPGKPVLLVERFLSASRYICVCFICLVYTLCEQKYLSCVFCSYKQEYLPCVFRLSGLHLEDDSCENWFREGFERLRPISLLTLSLLTLIDSNFPKIIPYGHENSTPLN